MTAPTPLIHVVDDDESLRTALLRLLDAAGFKARGYASVGDFLLQLPPDGPGCVLLDVRMPGPSGLDLQAALLRQGNTLPVVFLTGYADVAASVQAMKSGAVDFLTKPVDENTLTEAVDKAIIKQSEMQRQRTLTKSVQERLATLTRREREVMQQVMTGAMNKQIAVQLGISEKTVKVHRAHVMQKMHTSSAAELVALCAGAKLLRGTPVNHPDRQ